MKILAFQNPEFKILAFQNPEFKIFPDFKLLASTIPNSRFLPISRF